MNRKTLFLTAIALLAIAAGVAIFFKQRREQIEANEQSAIGSMRKINIAESVYRQSFPQEGFPCDLNKLFQAFELQAGAFCTACLFDDNLRHGIKSGYRFRIHDCKIHNGKVVGYSSNADPIGPGRSGNRSFCSNETGVIMASSEANCKNP